MIIRVYDIDNNFNLLANTTSIKEAKRTIKNYVTDCNGDCNLDFNILKDYTATKPLNRDVFWKVWENLQNYMENVYSELGLKYE